MFLQDGVTYAWAIDLREHFLLFPQGAREFLVMAGVPSYNFKLTLAPFLRELYILHLSCFFFL